MAQALTVQAKTSHGGGAFWDSTHALSPPDRAATAPSKLHADSSATLTRLWAAFMTTRVMVALAVLGVQTSVALLAGQPNPWMIGAAAVYAVLTVATRIGLCPRGRDNTPRWHWLATLGVDLVMFAALQQTQPGTINYTPLFALPVLMASVLGPRGLGLATAAAVTLLMLGHALGLAALNHSELASADIAQSGFAGAGMFALALLTNQLSTRLEREEAVARRNRVEARTQAMVNSMVIENLPDGVLVADADRVVRAANPAARAMLGSDHEVTPHAFSLDDDPAWAPLARLVQLTFVDSAVKSTEITLRQPGQEPHHLLVRTQRTPDIGDRGRSLCVIFLQDLREVEARVRTEKLAAMGRMSAAVAHEIRNPLAAISQANALLEEDLTDSAHQRLTRMVRQNAQRLDHIVDDVLDIARVRQQADDDARQTLRLDAEVSAACADWAAQTGAAASLQLTLNADGTEVRFAADHLRRILVNLLDNAQRYAGRSSDSIQVSTHAVRHGPVMVLVWSDGAPLDAGVRRHLFEPFFSSDSRSSGLGLYICRELCERHGAVIAYERTTRVRSGQMMEGNEFFISFQRPAAFAARPLKTV